MLGLSADFWQWYCIFSLAVVVLLLVLHTGADKWGRKD